MPVPAHAIGVTVHLTVGDRAGQGVALSRGLECSVITAFHVVGDGVEPIHVTRDGRTSPATREMSFPDMNLAVINVANPREVCREDAFLELDGLDQRLKQSSIGVLKARNEDGSEHDIPVQLARWNVTRIYIRSLPGAEPLTTTLSGSPLFVGDMPVGILLSVPGGRRPLGRVYRIDRINERLNHFLPLGEPPESRVRLDPGLAATVTRRHLKHMASDEFCVSLWQLSKWIANPIEDYGFRYTSKVRTDAGSEEYSYESILFPGLVTRIRSEPSGLSSSTIVGFIPPEGRWDDVWKAAEGAITGCLQRSEIPGKLGQVQLTDGPRQRKSALAETTNWTVQRTSRFGVPMESANLVLSRTGSEIVLRVSQ